MGRHRQGEGVSRTDPTQILPIVKQRRLMASPLLLVAGAVALTLVLGVGGWALMGSRGGGDPLVFPWSGDKPGDIDVSVSMEPTNEPVLVLSDAPSPSPSASRPKAPRQSSPTPLASVRVSVSPSRSAESLASTLSATVAGISGWSGNIMINVDVRNAGTAPVTAWTVELWLDKDVDVYEDWNSKDQQVDVRHLKFVQDRTLNAGETIRFGFIARYGGSRRPQMQTCKIDSRQFTCSVG